MGLFRCSTSSGGGGDNIEYYGIYVKTSHSENSTTLSVTVYYDNTADGQTVANDKITNTLQSYSFTGTNYGKNFSYTKDLSINGKSFKIKHYNNSETKYTVELLNSDSSVVQSYQSFTPSNNLSYSWSNNTNRMVARL